MGLARRRGSILGTLSFILLAVLLIGTAVMVYDYGSFSAAGAVIDRWI
jgi:hypothetical protein